MGSGNRREGWVADLDSDVNSYPALECKKLLVQSNKFSFQDLDGLNWQQLKQLVKEHINNGQRYYSVPDSFWNGKI